MEKLGQGILTMKNEEGEIILKERVNSITYYPKDLEVERLKGGKIIDFTEEKSITLEGKIRWR